MIEGLHKFRFWLLGLVLVMCALLWPGVRAAVQVDNSLKAWFLEGDASLQAYRDFQQRFGNDEVIIVVVHGEQSVLTPAYFRRFRRLSQALERLPAVAGVIGPGNAVVPTRAALGGSAQPLLGTHTQPADVRQLLANHAVLREQLFSPDYRTARLLVHMRQLPDFDAQRGDIVAAVQRTVYAHMPREHAYLGGVGVIYAGLNALSQQDFGFFLGLGYLLMFAVFALLYRNGWLLLYVLGIVGLATYVTLGVYGALGYRLTLMTVLLPVVLILLGFMDAMHVINERNLLAAPGMSRQESALRALRNTFSPCLATMLTTVAGFLALVTSPMAILQNFGLFAALGIALCLLFTFLLGVLILPHAKPAPRATRTTSAGLARLYEVILGRKGVFAAASVALVLLAAAGATRLQADTYTLGYFPRNHAVVRDHQAMEKTWGPYMPLELLIEPKPGHQLADAAVVQAAAAFADSARTLPGVGRVFGFQSLYEAGLETRFPGKGRAALRSQSLLRKVHAQLTADYPQLAAQFMHQPSQTGRITVSGAMLSARQLTAKTDTLLRMARNTLGNVAAVRPAGYQPLYARIVQYVTTSQTNSLMLSAFMVFGLVWLYVRSFRLALLTVVPNLFPVLVLLGVMGWFGIALDTATASIGAIVLGLCVDDTVHYIHHYRQARLGGQSPHQARLSTITHVGPTIVLTSLILFAGYAVMGFGSLKTVELFGVLTAVSVAAALFGEIIIFPLVLERFDREPKRQKVRV
ncbi:efflux RND transporter permease subunit [Hymenobacter latericus]|uniref:efflux RND transporter permease subunit n=1 Tax=Hymenobacter sp. YIM 151858-1 TaxID=2987688 RepID=UPI0022278452|nr:MMPL family transporter [Hymenobacter sp. YIM 151858-1]UYZ59480.1 MMPL family transporter [Hymenobacter sp. YIM 151858-1]